MHLYDIFLWNVFRAALFFSAAGFWPIWLSYASFRNESTRLQSFLSSHISVSWPFVVTFFHLASMFSSDICFSNKYTDFLSFRISRASTSNRYVSRTLNNIGPMQLSSISQYNQCLYSKRAPQFLGQPGRLRIHLL